MGKDRAGRSFDGQTGKVVPLKRSRAGSPAFSFNQDQLRSIYQSITDAVVVFDNSRRIGTVNPAAEAVLGATSAELTGARETGIAELDAIIGQQELVPPEAMVRCREEKSCARQECPSYNSSDRRCWLQCGTICHDQIQGTFVHKRDACERCQVFRNNSTVSLSVSVGARHYEINVAPILDDHGQHQGRLAVFHDTTVEHQRSTQLGLLFEIANSIAMTTDLRQALQQSLDFCISAMGASSGSIMLLEDGVLTIAAHRGLSQRIVDDFRQRLGEGISGWVAEKGEPVLITRVHPDPRFVGTRDLRDAVCIPIRNEANIVGVLCLNEKQTGECFSRESIDFLSPVAAQIGMALSRARLHEKIAADEQLKTTIVEGMGESLSVRGPDRTILFANSVHREIFGDDCVGRRCHEVYMGRDRVCPACPLERCFNSGDTVRHSPLLIDCLGTRRHMEATVSPVLDADGKVVSCIETSRDISELVQTRGQAESRLETLTTLFDISRTLSSSLELQHITSELARHTRKALDASAVAIFLFEEQKNGARRLVLKTSDGTTGSWGLVPGSVVDAAGLEPSALDGSTSPLDIADGHKSTPGVFPLAPPESQSVLVGRLTSREGLLGLMTVSSVRQKAFTDPALVDLFIDITNQAAVAVDNAAVYGRLEQTLWNTIRSLAEAVDAKDSYTRGHSDRVAECAEILARELDLDEETVESIRYAGYLHDTGKIGVPDAVLNKAGRLTSEEYEIIMNHPVLSHKIIEPVDFLRDVKPLVRHHHERHDGTGYPDGLAGEEIPLGAKIIGIADAYEAMTSHRPYRQAMSDDAAIEELKRCSGTQFDPMLVSVFIELVEKGSLPYFDSYA